ncbi:AAA family ATPase [Citricoccus sp. GCM10030269]|uniref:AAA family ATPase n=1 Tax=Citricoccus sp. GCM10030269 TaxID=3273388 RepID=UPI00360606F9
MTEQDPTQSPAAPHLNEADAGLPDDGAVESDSRLTFPAWLSSLGSGTENDTMLRFAPSGANSIDISHSHPSGLSQFMSGRRTRLSTLLRDQDAFTHARGAARQLRGKIQELAEDRGVDVGYLAAGLATWRVIEDGRSTQMSAPVMLARLTLTLRAEQDDYELQITEPGRLNPALSRYFRDHFGVVLDPDDYQRAAYATAKFEPMPAMELLRSQGRDVRGLVVEHRLLVSTFADLADTASVDVVDSTHPVVSALYDAGTGMVPRQAELRDPGLPPLDERDPKDETLILDADPSQQRALDHISAGQDLVVVAPPGTGQTQTAANAVAQCAAAGKRVLVVAERTATLADFRRRLGSVNLDSLVLDIPAAATAEVMRRQLIEALLRVERAQEPAVNRLNATLVERRHQLNDHLSSLHNVRERWGCSPFQAMQSLAALTALDPAPSTTVRLKRSVLDATVNREETAAQLVRAGELGAFSRSSTESPWYGARLRNVQETEDAYGLAEDLAAALPVLREQLDQATEQAQLATGDTFAEWVRQIQLLSAVRSSLDQFTPDIFDRPVTDLISATASGQWRKQHGVEMSSMTRSRLRRVAKEYIRPGVHVSDLHESLVDVQNQRAEWTRWATSKRHPSVPVGLEALSAKGAEVAGQLARLQRVLAEPRSEAERLENLPVDELGRILDRLVADQETLKTLPERTLVADQLREHGLRELMTDLQKREVPTEQLRSELELAWWQSALEAMISGDDYLAMMDAESLRKIEAEYRLADTAHLEAGSQRLNWKMAQQWKKTSSYHRASARVLRSLLKDGHPDPESLSGLEPEMLQSLVPVWTTSPLALAEFPADMGFDTVILLDAESLALSTALGAISRGKQVVAFGDGTSGSPKPFNVSVDPTASMEVPRDVDSAFSALTRVLPSVELTTMHRGLERKFTRLLGEQLYDGTLDMLPGASELTGSEHPVRVEFLPGGTGMPGAGDEGVESTVAEVNRTMDLVFDHIRTRPDSSLAVITASPLHARRVAEAIRLNLPNNPAASAFFNRDDEPFVVAPMARAQGMVRDHIIFTLGYGRTPHGRVVHHFGPFSEAGGRELYATAMTRARKRLHVLTCVHPNDLDPDRLGNGAADFYALLSAYLNDAGPTAPAGPRDPLVADLADRLAQRHATVVPNFAGNIDLAVWNPLGLPSWDGQASAEQAVPVALISDGSEEYRQMSVRERSRQQPQQLERSGWRYHALWTIDVFADPEGCSRTISDFLGLPAAEDGPTELPDDGPVAPRPETLTQDDGNR